VGGNDGERAGHVQLFKAARVFFFYAYSLSCPWIYIEAIAILRASQERESLLQAGGHTSVISHQLAPSAPTSIACVSSSSILYIYQEGGFARWIFFGSLPSQREREREREELLGRDH
jgi:hypothetical protein